LVGLKPGYAEPAGEAWGIRLIFSVHHARTPNVVYFSEVDRGNHFRRLRQDPELFTTGARAAFAELR
jgi:hypothetical protein